VARRRSARASYWAGGGAGVAQMRSKVGWGRSQERGDPFPGLAARGRLKTLGTGKVQAAGDQPDGVFHCMVSLSNHLVPVAAALLAAPGPRLQVPAKTPNVGLAVHSGEPFGLRQHSAPLTPVARRVAGLEKAKVLPELRQAHFFWLQHGPLSVAISFEGTTSAR
jgi:hypothetical protein